MKQIIFRFFIFLIISIFTFSCSTNNNKMNESGINIIFLHHSTGRNIWMGDTVSQLKDNIIYKILNKINDEKARKFLMKRGSLPKLLENHNNKYQTDYRINEIEFPQNSPYGWKNYPYDYYNIWVKNGNVDYYMEEPTLNVLTKKFDVIIFKHCFPVSNIKPDTGIPDIDSEEKRIENYILQYQALKQKLLEFENTIFILWTGAVQVESKISEEEALRTKQFFDWVKNEWDEKSDNIYLWDFYQLETENGLYFKTDYAWSPDNSHPNETFSEKAAKLFYQRVIDILENAGTKTTLTGVMKD